MENKSASETPFPFAWPFMWIYETWEYSLDALQRSFLFIDVLSQRSARYHDHEAKNAPNVLKFGWELEVDGRKLSTMNVPPLMLFRRCLRKTPISLRV